MKSRFVTKKSKTLKGAESRLADALRANGKAMISLVAVGDDQVLAHILFSTVTTTPPNTAKGIGLAPVAVHPDFQSHGIGSQLIRDGLWSYEKLELVKKVCA